MNSNIEKVTVSRIKYIITVTAKIGLNDTSNLFSILLKKREENSKWDWELLDKSNSIICDEVQKIHPSLSISFQILNSIMNRCISLFERKGNRKKINFKLTEEELQILETTHGKIIPIINRVPDGEARLYLAFFAYLLLYELRARKLESFLTDIMTQCGNNNPQLIEDLFMIYFKGTDNISDATHVRNAFAHGHFMVLPNYSIHIWDKKNGISVYDRTYDTKQFLDFINLFEKKLSFAEIYINFFIVCAELISEYKEEWREFEKNK